MDSKNSILTGKANNKKSQGQGKNTFQKLIDQRQLIFISLPFVILVIVFNYIPLWGWLVAFFDYKVYNSVWDSQFEGLRYFKELFGTPDFYRAFKNTIAISTLKLATMTISSIGLAVMINEVRRTTFKRVFQTVTYLPHFVSWVIAAHIVNLALSTGSDGILNNILLGIGAIKAPILFMGKPELFAVIAAVSNVWKEVGWGSIIYLSAMTGIDSELYEAADIDGAGRISKIFHITLASIMPTIKIVLILNLGWLMSAGMEQIMLLMNPATLNVAEVFDLFVLRYGFQLSRYSYATAAGIVNSIISIVLIYSANRISKAVSGEKAF